MLKTELEVAAQFRQKRESYRGQAARLLLSIENLLNELQCEVIQLEGEKEVSAKAKKDAIARRDESRRFQKHYERRRRLLAIDEAEKELVRAQEAQLREENWLAALKAAYRLRRIEDCKKLICDFVRQKQELEKRHEPDRNALERLGRRISDFLDQRISEIKNKIESLTTSYRQGENEQKSLQNDLLQTTREISAANQSLSAVRSFLNEVDQERRRLREQGILLPPSETGAEAIKRWQATAQEYLDNATRLKTEINITDNRIEGLRGQVQEKQTQRSMISSEISRLRTWLEGVDAQANRLLQETVVTREIGDSQSPNLYNPSLQDALEKYVDDCQRSLLNKTVEGAADKRIVEHCRIHQNSTFPPPVGIELIIEKLRLSGVTSAIPAYQWLSENCEAGQASRLLLDHPALYSGIIVQATAQLDAARAVITTGVLAVSAHI